MNEQEIEEKAMNYTHDQYLPTEIMGVRVKAHVCKGYIEGYKQALTDVQKRHEEAIEEMDKWVEDHNPDK